MELYKIIIDVFPIILFVGSAIFFFAGVKNKQTVLEKNDEALSAELETIDKKIELIHAQNANTHTELELLKLRIGILDKAIR